MDPLSLMSTDPLMTPEQIIEFYIDRWSLEVTFEESRVHFGVETQRQWSDKAIARSTPCVHDLSAAVAGDAAGEAVVGMLIFMQSTPFLISFT